MIGYKTKQKGGVKAEESPDQTPSNKQELPPRVHEEHAVNERKPPVPGNGMSITIVQVGMLATILQILPLKRVWSMMDYLKIIFKENYS